METQSPVLVAVPRAGGDPEPAGRGARRRRRRSALSARSRPRRRRGRLRAVDRLDDGERLRAARADRGRERRSSSAPTWTPCRPPGRSSPSSTTASCGTPAARSSAPTTSRRSSRCSRASGGCSPRTVRTPGIELLFTPKEEVGLIGAYAFDHDRLHAELGYVYDQAAPIGEIILGAPWSRSMEVRFHGRAAHSGMFPEEGRSAIQAAAKAIADLRLGRVDDEHDGERRRDLRAERAATSSPSGARSSPRRARRTSRS